MNIFTPINTFTPTDTQELLYPYSGPPPMAYGSHTRLVLENVTRSYSFYSDPPDLGVKTTKKPLEDFNMEKTGSYFNKPFLLACTHKTFDKRPAEITEAVNKIQQILFHQKYAELAKGRQTWSFIRQKNVPAAMALKETVEMIEMNLDRKIGQSLAEYNQAIMDLFDLKSIKCPKFTMKKNYEGKVYNQKTVEKLSPSELWDLIATINTMSKSAERGKLKRRSIATPNMLLRGFVKVVEDLSSEILKRIPSSGIPVGGQEKLAKLTSIMGMASGGQTGELSGDEEKWNECIDPDAMRIMITTFLVRAGVPNWILEIVQIPFLFFKGKRAMAGPGIPVKNKYKDHKYFALNSEYLPDDCDDYLFAVPLYDEKSNTLLCRIGMFMGMFNFTSTLLALVTIEGRREDTRHVQSSDDFIHFFEASHKEEIINTLAPKLFMGFRAAGICMSRKKSTLIIPAGIGEFNSNHHHKEFVGNVGKELPSITPAGFNSSTDLRMGLQVIRNAMATFEMLLPSGCLALRLFLKAYRHAYLVEGETQRKQYIKKLKLGSDTVIAQGGTSPYSISTIHLDELALKVRNGDLSKEYLLRVMNPDNPFSGGQAVLTLKNESKKPVLEEDTSVGSIFKFQFARNRTVMNTPESSYLQSEKNYATVTTAIESIMPEVLLGITSHTGNVEQALRTRLESMIESSGLPQEKKKEILESIDIGDEPLYSSESE